MGLLRGMREQWSACKLLYLAEIAGVVDVSMREKDRLDVMPIQANLLEHAHKLGHLACEPGVDEYGFARCGFIEKMEIAEQSADRINPMGCIQGIEPGHASSIMGNLALSTQRRARGAGLPLMVNE